MIHSVTTGAFLEMKNMKLEHESVLFYESEIPRINFTLTLKVLVNEEIILLM